MTLSSELTSDHPRHQKKIEGKKWKQKYVKAAAGGEPKH